jgi:hypothetical protein
MYLYFLPLPTFDTSDPTLSTLGPLPRGAEALISIPTHDGGVEHTAARFLPVHAWLDLARRSEIILFTPQFFLLSIVARFLDPLRQDAYSNVDHLKQRRALEAFVRGGSPTTPWAEVCISPMMAGMSRDGRSVLSLAYPGDEVKERGRKGLEEYVVLMGRGKGGSPNNVEVRLRKDVKELLEKAKV